MGKKSSGSTSKVKLSNKSSNKRMKASRRHKLNKHAGAPKTVSLPKVSKSKVTKVRNSDLSPGNINKEDSDPDEGFSDDEIAEFLDENTGNLSFLSANLNSPADVKSRKRKAENDVAVYEKVPRTLSGISQGDTLSKKVALLPIKTDKGLIQRSAEREFEEKDEEFADEENEAKEPEEEQAALSFVELLAKRKKEVNAKKMHIAQLSQDIVENPEKNISILKSLLALCKEEAVSVRILAILSLAEVFKDIIPSYRIRELSNEERAIKVSRDVRKLRDFEESLLSNYQKYLNLLEDNIKDCVKLLKRKRKSSLSKSIEVSFKPVTKLAVISTKCLCQLLQDLSHFNFRSNIIAVLVPNIELSDELSEVSDLCFDTIKELFKSDSVGEISLDIVKVIHKLVKSKPSIKPKVLETLLSLRLSTEVLQSASQRSSKIERLKEKQEAIRKMSKKEKKRKKVEDKLSKELQEAEAYESKEKIERVQTETLKFLFVTYFRILKAGHSSPLLSVVLKGLSKFAHLINVEFFEDLMTSIKSLLETGELGVSEKLSCILTALKILSGQGEALTIDPRQFYTELYSLLPLIGADCSKPDLVLIKLCLNIMLVKRRKQVSLPQVLGFFKRLSTMLLQFDADTMFDFLMIVRNVLQLHKKCDYLLDNEAFGCGIFQPEVLDPEHSNADSTALWEMCLLSNLYQANMGTYTRHVLNAAPSQGAGSLPTKLLQRRAVNTDDSEDLGDYFHDSIPKKVTINSRTFNNDNWKSDALSSYVEKLLINIEEISQTFVDMYK